MKSLITIFPLKTSAINYTPCGCRLSIVWKMRCCTVLGLMAEIPHSILCLVVVAATCSPVDPVRANLTRSNKTLFFCLRLPANRRYGHGHMILPFQAKSFLLATSASSIWHRVQRSARPQSTWSVCPRNKFSSRISYSAGSLGIRRYTNQCVYPLTSCFSHNRYCTPY